MWVESWLFWAKSFGPKLIFYIKWAYFSALIRKNRDPWASFRSLLFLGGCLVGLNLNRSERSLFPLQMFKDLIFLQNLNGPLKRRIIKCPEYSRILHKSNSEFLKEDVLSPPQKIQWCDMVAEETLLVCEGRCHQLGVWTLHSPNTQDQNDNLLCYLSLR